MFNLGALMEQLQQELDALQKRLQSTTYEGGAARDGQVRAWANGLQLLIALEVSPPGLTPPAASADDIVKACNAALRQARESLNQELARLTGGGIDFSSDNNWL